MIVIRGNYYDGKTSAQVPAECRVFDNGAVHVRDPGIVAPLLALPRFDLKVSPRLANTPRYIYFPHGEKFETEDNPAVDDLLKRFQKQPRLHIVHVLESRTRYILICLVAMSAVMWAVGRYGVPAAARVIAHELPSSVVQKAGSQTLDILDRTVFTPSRLDESVRQRVTAHVEPLVQSHSGLRLQIHFRKGGRLGANAFALPNGALVLTDEMVTLARHDDELLAVLAHEAGHVVHRHGVQRIIQDSLLAFAIMAVTGDVSGTSQVFLRAAGHADGARLLPRFRARGGPVCARLPAVAPDPAALFRRPDAATAAGKTDGRPGHGKALVELPLHTPRHGRAAAPV